jgi:hypothetical protein
MWKPMTEEDCMPSGLHLSHLPHLRDQLLAKEKGFNKAMDVEPSTSHPKASQGWEPGKCIPQSDKLPRYTISSTRVGEHTQFMREHALIGKFLGLWPSEWDLMRWIKYWWNPKGDYEVQLNSKGFFTIILYSLEDKDRIFIMGHTSTTQLGYSSNSGWTASSQRKKISQWIQSGYDYTPYRRNSGWRKS